MKSVKRAHTVRTYEFTVQHLINALGLPYGSKLRVAMGVGKDSKLEFIELKEGWPHLEAVHEGIPSYEELPEPHHPGIEKEI